MPENWTQWISYGHAFAVRLRAVRTMRGLSQIRLGELSGVSRNQISNLERNTNNDKTSADPTMSTIYKLARALHVPPVVLLPAPGEFVVDRFQGDVHADIEVDIVWPREATDIASFDRRHLLAGYIDDLPRFDARDLAQKAQFINQLCPREPSNTHSDTDL
ncbi:helix-turn-helix domain-containing protein [Corynebacterium kutscheri]|uniref:helix-turn-helix domain-containing protein n=1 Tax=Corynebacterium kutscheri TaxID=35755 RepID=UPI0037C04ABD